MIFIPHELLFIAGPSLVISSEPLMYHEYIEHCSSIDGSTLVILTKEKYDMVVSTIDEWINEASGLFDSNQLKRSYATFYWTGMKYEKGVC